MSAYRFVTLTCDICGEIWDECTTTSRREARRAARMGGWVCSERGDRDECPLHHGYTRTGMGCYERIT